jgi:hypothetical protein
MAWQPSRIVPGLAQYLAAKGLPFAPSHCGQHASASAKIHLDAASHQLQAEPKRPTTPLHPPAKRVKADAHEVLRRSESSTSSTTSVADHFHSDGVPATRGAVGAAKPIDDLPLLLRRSLLPFQEEGITFAIQRGARVMIADDMGLGSTLPLCVVSLLL